MLFKIKSLFLIVCISTLFIFFGCAGKEEPTVPLTEGEEIEKLYNSALTSLAGYDYYSAARLFSEVVRQYPYSTWSNQAEIMSAYCYYRYNNYDDAIAGADRFISLNPAHKHISYVYYLKAISYYEQSTDVGTDQTNAMNAKKVFNEIIDKFPTTDYARDAKFKLDSVENHLAAVEMEVGRFYLTRGKWVAAINRFKTVVIDYQTTNQTPEALHRLVESYIALGIKDEAQATAAVLGYNFPDSEWYLHSYYLLTGIDLFPKENKKSWASKLKFFSEEKRLAAACKFGDDLACKKLAIIELEKEMGSDSEKLDEPKIE